MADSKASEQTLVHISGTITQAQIARVGTTLKSGLLAGSPEVAGVFSIYVEMAQNVLRHSIPTGSCEVELAAWGDVWILESESAYVIITENPAHPENVSAVQARVKELIALDAGELRMLSKERLREKRARGERGAGIGLIEISRRANAPLKCESKNDKNGNHLLRMTATIHKIQT